MKIFGTIYPFIESNDSSLKLGRHVANYEFLKALLQHSEFDEFHLFCMNANHFKQTSTKLLNEDINDSQKSKVKLFLYDHLTSMISKTIYNIFHLGGWGYFFPGLTYIRNKYARNLFPITGLIHSLNGKETNFHAYKMIHAPLLPYDTIICSSMAGRNVLQKSFNRIESEINIKFKGNFEIIPLGIEDKPLKSYEEYRKIENLDINTVRILTIGRISPTTKYDPYPLITAVADIINENPELNIELIIAGGANQSELSLVQDMITEENMQNHIKVVTNFTNNQKDILYGSSDIYVSLIDNLQETFGISIIEAMQTGLPVIASDINGYKELIQQNKTGFKIPSLWCNDFFGNELSAIMDFNTLQHQLAQNMALDLEEFKNKLLLLINDKEKRRRMGQKACKDVNNRFTWPKIIKKYEDLWRELYQDSIKIDNKRSSYPDIFSNDYINTFSHYPTVVLPEHLHISISKRGKKAIKNNSIPLAYNIIQPLLNNKNILNSLKKLNESPRDISEFISQITQFELLWMIKYGLVKIDDKIEVEN